VCYYVRVAEGHFDRDMFIVTDQQRQGLDRALDVAAQLQELSTAQIKVEDDDDDDDDDDSAHPVDDLSTR
jgi:hypothetical protein